MSYYKLLNKNDITQVRNNESNWKISGSDKYGGKGSFSRHGIVISSRAGLFSYTRGKVELNKMTDNQYAVLTNFRPTLSDTDTLEAAFQTTGLLLFRATDAL
jgi:hypothetical protein